jgi:UDP:flavonoid glycosyltransferase YjiC (YdhE family)
MKRLKVARVIQKSSYTPRKVAHKLRVMLDKPGMAQTAEIVAQMLRGEDGVKTACDALEKLHANSHTASNS